MAQNILKERNCLLKDLKEEKSIIAALRASIADLKESNAALDDPAGENDTGDGHAAGESGEPDPLSKESEWKARCENQTGINEQLEQQTSQLKARIQHEKGRLRILMQGGELDELKGSSIKRTLIQLTREKNNLESQLRDYEWRLDQEGDAFNKISEKRKALVKDVSKSTGAGSRSRRGSVSGDQKRGKRPGSKAQSSVSASSSVESVYLPAINNSPLVTQLPKLGEQLHVMGQGPWHYIEEEPLDEFM